MVLQRNEISGITSPYHIVYSASSGLGITKFCHDVLISNSQIQLYFFLSDDVWCVSCPMRLMGSWNSFGVVYNDVYDPHPVSMKKLCISCRVAHWVVIGSTLLIMLGSDFNTLLNHEGLL